MKYDLSRLFIKFQECPDGVRLVDHFQDLSVYEEFANCPDDTYIKLAILTGDIDSPISTVSDRNVLVRTAFDILSINVEKNKDLFDDIVSYKNIHYMDCWLKYLFIQNEVLFTDWMLVNKDYEYFLSQSGKPKDEGMSDKNYLLLRRELRSTISDLGAEKKRLEAQLFPDSKAAREASIHENKKKIHTWAEEYAERFNYY